VSNNVYFGTVGLRTGIDKIYEVAKTMGLTDYPWIEYDAVSKGIIPNQQWKKEVVGEPWYPGDTVNTSIVKVMWRFAHAYGSGVSTDY